MSGGDNRHRGCAPAGIGAPVSRQNPAKTGAMAPAPYRYGPVERGGSSSATTWGPGSPGGDGAAAHLLELGARGHLLGEQRGLDAVEEALEPADELGLGDPQLGLGGHGVVGEGQRQAFELVDELRGQPGLELGERAPVDVAQPDPGGLVERRGAHLLEQLLDHRADPHDLRRLLDQLGDVARRRPRSERDLVTRRRGRPSHRARSDWPSGSHHHDALLGPRTRRWIAHTCIQPDRGPRRSREPRSAEPTSHGAISGGPARRPRPCSTP